MWSNNLQGVIWKHSEKTNKQMLLFKGKAIAAKKNYKEKSQWFQTFTFHFAWRARGCPRTERILRFSDILRFSNYLILSKSFERHMYDSVYSYLSRITCCMARMIAVWFSKKENSTETAPSWSDRFTVYRTSCSLILQQ